MTTVTLKVDHARLSKVGNMFGETSPLANVRIKVSARTRGGRRVGHVERLARPEFIGMDASR